MSESDRFWVFMVKGWRAAFSMYALNSILPFLPAKQRPLHENDWMLSDTEIACPDPNCGAQFRITRTKKHEFSHAGCTTEPAAKEGDYDATEV